MKDVKFVFRQVRNRSGLIAAALVTVALCFAVSCLIPAIINSVLLRYFPLPMPDQLATMFSTPPGTNVAQEQQEQIPNRKSKI
jgi:hypothetical protein